MLKKMSQRRRAAFLRALEATGNQTLAAERACVSRSWVCKERSLNAGFDAACRAAIGAAKERLTEAGENAPPSGWGHLDGVELVVRGARGRRVQVARARAGQISPKVEDRFLAVLAATCNVKAALAAAGISKSAAYTHRKRWPGFARRWHEALEVGELRLELAVAHHAANPASSTGLPEPAPMAILLTPEQALHSLHMHKNRLFGLGRRPGRQGRPPGIEQVTAKIVRICELIKRGRGLSEEAKSKDEAQWALRRGPGEARRRGSA
jgi:hypothetical protein